MAAMNQPGCGQCCVEEPGCLPDVAANPCVGDRVDPPTALFRWITDAEIAAGQYLPEGDPLDTGVVTSNGWWYMVNGVAVSPGYPGEFADCVTALGDGSGGSITEVPYSLDAPPNGDPDAQGETTTLTCTYGAIELSGAGCLKCRPRYRCANVTFTPSAYSTRCPGRFSTKMWYSCADTWTNDHPTVGVSLQLYRRSSAYDGCECLYRVSVAADGETESFDGIPLDELGNQTYSVSTSEGDYTVEIGGASGIPNPLASAVCAPCICATCLPSALLVSVDGIASCPNAEFCGPVGLCDGTNSITFTLSEGDVTVTVGPKPASDGVCALNVTISATFGTLTGGGQQTISLESIEQPEGQECGDLNIFSCREVPNASAPDEFLTSGTRGSGTCPGIASIPFIDVAFPVKNGGFDAFTIRIRDGACGECSDGSPTCKGACKELESYGLSCISADLTAEILSECQAIGTAMVPQENAGFITNHPLQDGTIGTEFCQAFYSGVRTSPTTTQPLQEFCCGEGVRRVCHQFYFAMYYNGLPCSDAATTAQPEGYRLAVSFARVCTDLDEPATIEVTVGPSSYSCSPPAWEFHTGITWGDLYGTFTDPYSVHPCNDYTKCCENDLDEEIVIRVTL